MDREKFGTFVATKRKEKGMTQLELAERLLVSDKAVSKWERGLSYPDITMLEPLSKILSVTLIELLEGKEMTDDEKLKIDNVDEVVKSAVDMSENNLEKKKNDFVNRLTIAMSMLIVAVLETVVMLLLKVDFERISTYYWTVEGLSLFFGFYYWTFAKEILPAFYDEQKMCFYSDGFMRMNVPGVRFNNSNWPHIIKSIRIWSLVVTIAFPTITFIEDRYIKMNLFFVLPIILIVVFSIFVPIYIAAKKYE